MNTTLLQRKLLPWGIATLVLTASSAIAQDAAPWNGGYAGVQVGYLGSDQTIDYKEDIGGFSSTASPDPDGAEVGIYGGYNWQVSSALVLGVEAEYNFSNADGSADEVEVFSKFPGVNLGRYETKINETGALRGRVGYIVGGNLIYGTLGLAYIDYDVDYINPAFAANSGRFSENDFGWTVGFGGERNLTDNWVGRIDYRYSDFGDENIGSGSLGNTNFAFDVSTFKTHEIRIGLAWKF